MRDWDSFDDADMPPLPAIIAVCVTGLVAIGLKLGVIALVVWALLKFVEVV